MASGPPLPFLTATQPNPNSLLPSHAVTNSRPIASGSGSGTKSRERDASAKIDSTVSNAPVRMAGRKRKSQGRGRMMMVKVFYSLSSARLSSNPTPSGAQSTSYFPPSTTDNDSQPANQYTCLARLSAPVWVQLLGNNTVVLNGTSTAPVIEYGKVTLKTCLSAICISRPELVADSTKDYAVSAVDPYESSLQPSAPSASSTSSLPSSTEPPSHSDFHRPHNNIYNPGQGLMEGKGMLSWNLAEKREGTTWVCGRVVRGTAVVASGGSGEGRSEKRRKLDLDTEEEPEKESDEEEGENVEEEGPDETLEVWLQLVERPSFTQTQFLTSLRSFANPPSHLADPSSDRERASSPPHKRPTASSHHHPHRSHGHSHNRLQVQTGDPIKKKRPLSSSTSSLPPSQSLSLPSSASISALNPLLKPNSSLPHSTSLPDLSTLGQNPQVLALLSQLLPTLSADPEQARSLLPAIRTLVNFYGIDTAVASTSTSTSTTTTTNTNDDIVVDVVDTSFLSSLTNVADQEINHDNPSTTDKGEGKETAKSTEAGSTTGAKKFKKKGDKPKEEFVPIDAKLVASVNGAGGSATKGGNTNPLDANGCFNCRRKKSVVWRQRSREDGAIESVCNACGVFFNKNGYHRSKGERTSPAVSTRATATTSSNFPFASDGAQPSSTTVERGGSLQRRLTATCDAELKRVKKRKSNSSNTSTGAGGGGWIPPPSPSKHIGPSSHRSPGTYGGIFRSHTSTNSTARNLGVAFTSPGRSPRRNGAGRFSFGGMMAATSPVRAGGGGGGLRSGFESGNRDGGGGDSGGVFDFAAIYGRNQSPSPERSNQTTGAGVPTYLLTASPGTALKRILNDTNVDLNTFGISMSGENLNDSGVGGIQGAGRGGGGAGVGNNVSPDDNERALEELSMYLRSSPEEQKENDPLGLAATLLATTTASTTNANTLANSATTSMVASGLLNHLFPLGGSTDPENSTSSTDFESVFSDLRRDFRTSLSSTSPSSPTPSSPCVQPRTSSATPGQKGKGPASSGRAPPSIMDSYLDSLVPAIALQDVSGEGKSGSPWGSSPARRGEGGGGGGGGGQDSMMLDEVSPAQSGSGSATGGRGTYDLSHLLRSSKAGGRSYLPTHFLTGSTTNGTSNSPVPTPSKTPDSFDFDLGSLPPSSPPALPPSETGIPTPSDFGGSGITPDTETYLGEGEEEDDDEDTDQQSPAEDSTMSYAQYRQDERAQTVVSQSSAVAALLQSLGIPQESLDKLKVAGGVGNGCDRVELDRESLKRLLQMLSESKALPNDTSTSTSSAPTSLPLPLVLPNSNVTSTNATPQRDSNNNDDDEFSMERESQFWSGGGSGGSKKSGSKNGGAGKLQTRLRGTTSTTTSETQVVSTMMNSTGEVDCYHLGRGQEEVEGGGGGGETHSCRGESGSAMDQLYGDLFAGSNF